MKKQRDASLNNGIASAVGLFVISIVFIALAFLFQERLGNFRGFGLLGIFLINFFGSATIFLPAPAIASVVAGGIVYPFWAVAIVAALGAAVGDMLGFLLGLSGAKLFIKNNKKLYEGAKHVFRRYGEVVIFVFAFVPNPLFDAIGIVAGVLRYSWIRFFVLMFLGRLFRDFLLAYAGSAL